VDYAPSSPFDLRPHRESTEHHFEWVFPYAPVPVGRPLPVIEVVLELPGSNQWMLPLGFDSGTDVTLVNGGAARFRGFDPRSGARRVEPVTGVGGAAVVYVHNLRCHLVPPEYGGREVLAVTLPVAFTDPDGPAPPLNVLGREGFLDRFAVAIEGYLLPPRLYLAPRRSGH
jgi:hypothetical protein